MSLDVTRERIRILLIDDDPGVREALARLLRSHHDVDVACGAAEAERLIAASKHYDAIICDVVMPEQDGADFFEALPPALAARVVFITGGGLSPSLAARVEQSGRPILTKPASLGEIEQVLEELRGSLTAG